MAATVSRSSLRNSKNPQAFIDNIDDGGFNLTHAQRIELKTILGSGDFEVNRTTAVRLLTANGFFDDDGAEVPTVASDADKVSEWLAQLSDTIPVEVKASTDKPAPKATTAAESPPKKDEAESGFLRFINKDLKGEILASMLVSGGTAIAGILGMRGPGDSPQPPAREVAAGATEVVVKEGEHVAVVAARAGQRRFKTIARFVLVVLGVWLLLFIFLPPVAILILLLLIASIWAIKRLTWDKIEEIKENNNEEWFRRAADEYPTVLHLTPVSFEELADINNPDALKQFVANMRSELNSLFNFSNEADLDKITRELTARAVNLYGGVEEAQVIISDATFIAFPEEFYTQTLPGNPPTFLNPQPTKSGFWQ